jgi:hypothetical protein
MFFLQYKAVPLQEEDQTTDGIVGAYVNCWINRATVAEAEIAAKTMIESSGWEITETLEVCPLSEENPGLGEDALGYFRQAQVDGEVLVFFTFPNNESDAEEISK